MTGSGLGCAKTNTAWVIKRLADRVSRATGLHPEPDHAAQVFSIAAIPIELSHRWTSVMG
jgi:hypothetical protein